MQRFIRKLHYLHVFSMEEGVPPNLRRQFANCEAGMVCATNDCNSDLSVYPHHVNDHECSFVGLIIESCVGSWISCAGQGGRASTSVDAPLVGRRAFSTLPKSIDWRRRR